MHINFFGQSGWEEWGIMFFIIPRGFDCHYVWRRKDWHWVKWIILFFKTVHLYEIPLYPTLIYWNVHTLTLCCAARVLGCLSGLLNFETVVWHCNAFYFSMSIAGQTLCYRSFLASTHARPSIAIKDPDDGPRPKYWSNTIVSFIAIEGGVWVG